MKVVEVICIINGICLIGLIFIRTPLKMARIETNTNKSLDNTILVFTAIYTGLVLSLKCW